MQGKYIYIAERSYTLEFCKLKISAVGNQQTLLRLLVVLKWMLWNQEATIVRSEKIIKKDGMGEVHSHKYVARHLVSKPGVIGVLETGTEGSKIRPHCTEKSQHLNMNSSYARSLSVSACRCVSVCVTVWLHDEKHKHINAIQTHKVAEHMGDRDNFVAWRDNRCCKHKASLSWGGVQYSSGWVRPKHTIVSILFPWGINSW